jgi:uridine kinase
VLIVDGVFAFRPEINRYWDFRIWLDVDEETSVGRGANRDQSWAGSEAETLHRTRYLPAERRYLAEVDPLSLVDMIIDNSVFGRPRILRPQLPLVDKARRTAR